MKLDPDQLGAVRDLRFRDWPVRRIAAALGLSYEAVRVAVRDMYSSPIGGGTEGETLDDLRANIAIREEIRLMARIQRHRTR